MVFRWFMPETDNFQAMKAEREMQVLAKQQVGCDLDSTWRGRFLEIAAFARESGREVKKNWVLLLFMVVAMTAFNSCSHGSQDFFPTFLKSRAGFNSSQVVIISVVGKLGSITGGTVLGYQHLLWSTFHHAHRILGGAGMCIEKTTLCHALQMVFDCLYEESHPKLGTKTEVTLILLPVANKVGSVSVSHLQDQLQDWPKSLPDELKSGAQDPVRPVQAENGSLDLIITRSFEDLEDHDLVRFLPSSGVTFLLTAAMNHLMDFKQGASQQRHLRRFQDCLSYMKVLKTVHVYAKYADLFLRHVALKFGLVKYPVPAGDRSDDKLVEREGLGPWATAHTPDLLVSQPNVRRQAVATDVKIPGDLREISDIAPSPLSNPHPTGLLPQDASQGYTQAAIATNNGATGCLLDNSPSCSVDDFVDGSGFLSNTLWEYGWVNQVTAVWPEETWRGGTATSHQPPSS